jgi:DNA-binding transcriptional LysR family regulator
VVRGEYSELHVGFRGGSIMVEMLPPALAAFQKAAPGVKVLLHELHEIIAGLRNATLDVAILVQPTGEQIAGIEFESLHTYPWVVVLTAAHPFARLKSVPLERVAAEALISLHGRDYREYLNRIFAPTGVKPRIAVECDTFASLRIEVEAAHGIALGMPISNAAATRLLYRPITGTTETLSVGIARATKGDMTPAGKKFCEILRNISNGMNARKPS